MIARFPATVNGGCLKPIQSFVQLDEGECVEVVILYVDKALKKEAPADRERMRLQNVLEVDDAPVAGGIYATDLPAEDSMQLYHELRPFWTHLSRLRREAECSFSSHDRFRQLVVWAHEAVDSLRNEMGRWCGVVREDPRLKKYLEEG